MIIYTKHIYQNIFFKFSRDVYISVFQIVLRGKQENPLSRGIGNFFIELWESNKEWFCTFEPFSKLKTRFLAYGGTPPVGKTLIFI